MATTKIILTFQTFLYLLQKMFMAYANIESSAMFSKVRPWNIETDDIKNEMHTDNFFNFKLLKHSQKSLTSIINE